MSLLPLCLLLDTALCHVVGTQTKTSDQTSLVLLNCLEISWTQASDRLLFSPVVPGIAVVDDSKRFSQDWGLPSSILACCSFLTFQSIHYPPLWRIGALPFLLPLDAVLAWYMLSSCVRLSVYPSVRLSQASAVPKWLNARTWKQCRTMPLDYSFLTPNISAKFQLHHP